MNDKTKTDDAVEQADTKAPLVERLVMCCCGYCGQPTDNDGTPLINVPDDFDISKAELVHGLCCADQVAHEQESRIVSREMAIDAGMPEIEGMQY